MSKNPVSPIQRTLNVWAVVLILWSLYRAAFKTDLPIWVDEFIAKPAIFLLPVYWYITMAEKKPFLEGVGLKAKHIADEVLWGMGVGSLFILIAVSVRIIKGASLPALQFSGESTLWAFTMIMAAAMEQILSTGFVFKRLSQEYKGIFRPFITSAILFFFLHIPILFGVEKISGSSLIQMIFFNTVLSFITSTLYMMRKNTIAPILVHVLYLLSLPILL